MGQAMNYEHGCYVQDIEQVEVVATVHNTTTTTTTATTTSSSMDPSY